MTLSLIDLSILMRLFVSRIHINHILPDASASLLPDLPRGVVLQGDFRSAAAREEFKQIIISHGIKFLRIANSPLPPPSAKDMSWIEAIASVITHFHTRKSGNGKQS